MSKSSVQAGDWTALLTIILSAALTVVKMIAQESGSVLVHCSDGWDRTPQVLLLERSVVMLKCVL